MRTAVIILIVLVILLIISAIFMNGQIKPQKVNTFVAPVKNKVKFGSKVTRMDYDKETGDIIPGKIIERLNDTG